MDWAVGVNRQALCFAICSGGRIRRLRHGQASGEGGGEEEGRGERVLYAERKRDAMEGGRR